MVVPGVLAAVTGAVGLLAAQPHQIPFWAPAGEIAVLFVVILSTAMLRARQHGARTHGFDAGIVRRLVRSNRIRVVAWPAAAVLSLRMCHRAFAS